MKIVLRVDWKMGGRGLSGLESGPFNSFTNCDGFLDRSYERYYITVLPKEALKACKTQNNDDRNTII